MGRCINLTIVRTLLANTKDKEIFRTNPMSGKLKQIIVDVPTGWSYSAGFRLDIGAHKYPAKLEETETHFSGDDTAFNLRPNDVFNNEPIILSGFNNSPTANHAFLLILEIELPNQDGSFDKEE